MNAEERTTQLFQEAIRLGCDTPTEGMVIEAMQMHQDQTFDDAIHALKAAGYREASLALNHWRELKRSQNWS